MSLLDHLATAGSISGADLHVKLLVQGRSGSGKTTIGAKMPKPLIILTEANGLPSIRAANPEAIVIRVYDFKSYKKSNSYEVLAEAMGLAASGAFTGVESIVCDSATEIQRIIREQILREKGVLDEPGYLFTQQDWGLLTERMRRFARMFRDLPYHVMMITLSAEDRDEDGSVSQVAPQFEGKKLPGEILQFFSAGGLAYKRMVKVEGQPDDVAFEVLFQGASKYLVKPCAPLRNVEHADPSDWIERISAHKPGDAPLPPLSRPKPAPAAAPAPAAGATPAPAAAGETPAQVPTRRQKKAPEDGSPTG